MAKTTKTKKDAIPPPGTEHWRAAGAFDDEDARTVDLAARPLSDALFASALEWSRLPAVLDVGVVDFDQKRFEGLQGAEKRAYGKLHTSLAQRRQTRQWLWIRLADALATRAEGRERLVELVIDPSTAPLVLEESLRALLGREVAANQRPNPPDVAVLTRLGSPLERATTALAARYATEVLLFSLSPSEALAAVRPFFEPDAAHDTPGGQRTQGILHATVLVRTWEGDAGWIDLIASVLSHVQHWPIALMAFGPGPNDPRVVSAVAAYVEQQPVGFFHEGAWHVLHRSGDPAMAPLLARSLGWLGGFAPQTLAFVRASGNAAAAPVIRDWIAKTKKQPGYEAIVAEGESVLAALGDEGPIEAKLAEDRTLVSLAEDQPMPPSVDEQEKALAERCRAAGLDVAKVRPLIRHAITMRATPIDSLPVGASHLGGKPDLPKGTKWPTLAGYPLAFALQVDLADVASFDRDELLPKKGLLSFFVADAVVHDGSLEYGSGKVLFFPDAQGLIATDMPEPTRAQRENGFGRTFYPLCKLTFATELQLPSSSHASVRKAKLDDVKYEEIAGDLGPPRHHLLGHRAGYDEAAKDERVLLQLASDDPSGMEWGDVEELVFRIKEKALRPFDPTKAKSRIGE
jgi:uncharacterized protein YwqG